MLLAIDAGNTNTVFAVHDGKKIVSQWRSATVDSRTCDEYRVWLDALMTLDNVKADQINHAIIASVVPQALFSLKQLCKQHFGTRPLVVGEDDLDFGLEAKIDRPSELGADRLVNAVAAKNAYGGPAIILDFGTATTFDVIDDAGDYIGGIIAPGINLSLDALHRAAAKLPLIAVTRPDNIIGTTTTSAMQSGVYWGYLGLIEGIIGRICDEYGSGMQVIATGGLAPLFAKETGKIDIVDADLTQFGLRMIFQNSQKSI